MPDFDVSLFAVFALFSPVYQERCLHTSHQRSIVPQSSIYPKNFTLHTAENT